MLGPLVHAAGQRIVRGRLGKGECDHQLAEHDDRPAPDKRRRPTDIQPVPEERVETISRGDEAERDGEVREEAERPVELLLVAELCQVLGVGLALRERLILIAIVLVVLRSATRPLADRGSKPMRRTPILDP